MVPVYNAKGAVSEALGSLVRQTWDGWRCVCVDDGSVDGSGEGLDAWSRREPRVVAIHQRNAGVSAARNRGIARASGAGLFFLDSDDMLHGECLGRLAHVASATRPDWVSCGVVIRDSRGTMRKSRSTEDVCLSRSQFVRRADVIDTSVVWGVLFDREWFVGHGLRFDTRLKVAEDSLLMTQAVCHAERIAHVGSCIGYAYTESAVGGGLMSRSAAVYAKCRMEALRILTQSGIWRRDEVARSCVKAWVAVVLNDVSAALQRRKSDCMLFAGFPLAVSLRIVWPSWRLVFKWAFGAGWVLVGRLMSMTAMDCRGGGATRLREFRCV